MDKDSRRAALSAYRMAKPSAGIYAIRFAGAEQVWIGAARDLSKIENRHRFELRIGKHRCLPLQQSWTTKGEAAFSLQTIEVLAEDTPEISVDRILKERLEHWLANMGAMKL